MIKAAIYLAGFYLVYRVFLSRDTLYGRNRTFILLSAISAMILPLITIRTNNSLEVPVFGKVLSEIFVSGDASNNSSSIAGNSVLLGYKWLVIIYMSGLIFFGLKLIFDFLELVYLIGTQEKGKSHIIKFHGLNTAGFSAFGHIFVSSRLTSEEACEIIKHEQNHLNHHHSADIILIELVMLFQWFNPAIYFFSRSLRAVHEYQADEECINLGISVNNYQKLLMNQIFKSKIFTITNSFSNPSLVKKRMIMMTKQRSGSLANFKLLLVLPVIASVMFFISSCSQSNNPPDKGMELAPPPPPPPPVADNRADTVFTVVDEFPVFKGGDAALLKYLAENTIYPEHAKKNGTQGKIIVRFAVNVDGSVDKISVLKGVDPELDIEAIRVVSTLPSFEKPGIKDGKAVPVWYMVPINYTLK
jgi:TonB family protein